MFTATDSPNNRAPGHAVIYTLDAEDRISSVNPAWDVFARENEGEHLCGGAVLQRCLWDFVHGEELQSLYRQCFDSVRRTHRRCELPFHCDGTHVRRTMHMLIEPIDNSSSICISNFLVQSEWRRTPIVLNRTLGPDPDALGQCSVCNRVHVRMAGWVDIEEALKRLNLMEGQWAPSLKPTVCDDCRRSLESSSSS